MKSRLISHAVTKSRLLSLVVWIILACFTPLECWADDQEAAPVAGNIDLSSAAEQTSEKTGTTGAEAPSLPKSSLKSAQAIQPEEQNAMAKADTKKSAPKKASKSKKTSKSAPKKASKSSSSSFSAEEIAKYKAMPVETWESPREISEKGLPIAEGFAQPYPYGNLMRQYNGNKCRHRGLDIGAVGEVNGGVGTVINSATKAKVTLIGRTGQNTGEFGKLDKRRGIVKRTGKKYPRQILAPGYGIVYPFSRTYGRWRSGMVIVTKVLEGPLKDYTIRYMHMADIRPDLKVGSIVEAGEHIALMGGTAVMDSWPHMHIDMETPDGRRADLAPYIGLPDTSKSCTGKTNSKKSKKTKKKAKKSSKKKNKKSSKKSKKK